ncbi:MAG TPA: nitronate monooxygenase [Thermoanaerobaculia bacterium]|nr:nitronate monooxygenase [Thermoanaerobaculia bacterium]
MKLHTQLCDLLKIEYPILQSGMRRIAGPELAAQVSNAGGLGILAGLLAKGEDLRVQIRRVRELTDRPFGVNLWLHSELRPPVDPAVLAPERVRAVQEALNVFRRRLGVAESTARPAPTPDTFDEAFEVILEERVPVFSTGLGEPDATRIARCHERGIRVLTMVATVEDARRVASAGVDAVVAQGAEAGGHRSFGVKPRSREEAAVGTMVLVPEVVDAVGVPVIAAGGIADGRGIAAALALGASGVMLGTRFVATKESQAAAFWKQAIVEARGDQTTITDVFTGLYARAIPNTFAAGYEASGAPVLPSLLQSSTAQDVYAASAAQGNRDYFPLLAGQSSGLIRDLPGAAEVVASLVAETQAALAAAAQRAGLALRAES